MNQRTCVLPSGRFSVGVHRPSFSVRNHRATAPCASLGTLEDGTPVTNGANFPPGDLTDQAGDWVYEIANPFPFRGATYILRAWAESKAADPAAIGLPRPPTVSFSQFLAREPETGGRAERAVAALPRPLKLALATTTTDPADLVRLANACADFVFDKKSGEPTGLLFRNGKDGRPCPAVNDSQLFDAVANNPRLPDPYKKAMVLRPGVQGESEIVGEWASQESHIFEYLRTNSYIPWGHYAANMADDAVRYDLKRLSLEDMQGLRHLYYQRTFLRLAEQLGLPLPAGGRTVPETDLEALRKRILQTAAASPGEGALDLDGILWGWNFGYDFSPSGYRLHASHQQIHQQYALVPAALNESAGGPEPATLPAYACGDLVADFIRKYRRDTGQGFFEAYEKAVWENRRIDGREDLEARLVVHADARAVLFVPKAQTSQWELQLMPRSAVGNVLEADTDMRRSLDRAAWTAVRVLGALGARMITCIEFSKRIGRGDPDQRLLYSFLPRLPESPGAFSEAQLRWINGHYPEDFARACRARLAEAAGAAADLP